MRMNITIEGKQSDISDIDRQRTKRCLKVLKEIGFDVRIDFTDKSDIELYEYTHPVRLQEPIHKILRLH